MTDYDLEQFSKRIAYILRHAPWRYGIHLDKDGSVGIDELLSAVERNSGIRYSREDLDAVMNKPGKKRYAIENGRIRAIYGHSISGLVANEKITPPEYLYHSTTHKALPMIMKEGLKPMNRQYVHLSYDRETALEAGRRREEYPVLLRIDAYRAYLRGINFYKGNNSICLADPIPSGFITRIHAYHDNEERECIKDKCRFYISCSDSIGDLGICKYSDNNGIHMDCYKRDALIMFRGKEISTGFWVYGYFVELNGDYCIFDYFGKPHVVDKDTVGQLVTRDVDGRDVFVGDIVMDRYDSDEDYLPPIRLIECNDLKYSAYDFYYRDHRSVDEIDEGNYEVIGNIFDNPELFERKDDKRVWKEKDDTQ